MFEALWVVIGVLVGVALGWFWGTHRTRPGMAKQLAETKVRGVRAVEHIKQEQAAELERRERELTDLRNTYEQERRTAAGTHAKLSADLVHALDETARLTDKAQTRGAELQHAIDESFREVGQFYEIGTSLEHAVEAFTRVIEGMESRLLLASKRMKELGLAIGPSAVAVESSGPDTAPPAIPPAPQPQGDVPAVEPVRGRSKH
jgi:hypothetical protein